MRLKQDEILNIFTKTEALLKGHFILTSGLHSDTYFQCAKVLQYPWYGEKLCRDIADNFKNYKIEMVVSPAVGGIIAGYEVARILNVPSIFTERVEGKMRLRRGFSIKGGTKILVIEDVTTTGGSVKEVIECVASHGGEVSGVGALVDRSGGSVKFGVPYFSLIKLRVENFSPEDCPMCRAGSTPVKPGSKGLS